jgi:hypothetical protein
LSQKLPPNKNKQEEKPHISISQINEYLDCSAYYMFHRVWRVQVPSKSFLTIGKVVAKAQEFNFKQKIESKVDLPIEQILKVAIEEFDGLIINTAWTDEEKEHIDDIRNSTLDLIRLYMKYISPKIQPQYVEEKILVELPELKMPVIFIPDVIDINGIIHDTKTSAKSPTGMITLGTLFEEEKSTKKKNEAKEDDKPKFTDADSSFQLTGYCLGYKQLTGKMPTGVQLDFLVKNKNPKCGYLSSTRTERDIQRFINISNSTIDGIFKGIFIPDSKAFKCSPEKCDFWNQCHEIF